MIHVAAGYKQARPQHVLCIYGIQSILIDHGAINHEPHGSIGFLTT